MPNLNKYILALNGLNTPLGKLVGNFATNPAGFVNDWITSEANLYVADPENYSEIISIPEDLIEAEDNIVPHYKLLKIEISYFRGIRETKTLDLSNKVSIIYGPNSSGKTTFTEALEWLFTGQLARYKANSTGQTTELKGCVKNALTPDEEATCVVLHIRVGNDEYRLKRVLERDYDGTQNSECSSKLYQNDIEIQQSNSILSQIILGQPPVLMQHSIGDFIRKKQDERASYFESLFNIEELSELIRIALIGTDELNGLLNSQTNNRFYDAIKSATLPINSATKSLLNTRIFSVLTLERVQDAIISDLKKLPLFASIEAVGKGWHDLLEEIKGVYKKSVLQKLPSENTIAPKKDISLINEIEPDNFLEIAQKQTEIQKLAENFEKIKESLKTIDEKSRVIYDVLKTLKEKQVISTEVEIQDCPLCLSIGSLTKTRIDSIEQTAPIQEALIQIINNKDAIFSAIYGQLSSFQQELLSLLPQLNDPVKNTQQASEDPEINKHIAIINPLLKVCWIESGTLSNLNRELDEKIKSQYQIFDTDIILGIFKIITQVPAQIQKTYKSIKDYHNKFKDLKKYLENGATSSEELQLAKVLIDLFENADKVLVDVQWFFAKNKISALLKSIREDQLIPFRQKIFESKETVLNAGIKSIWSIFRIDDHAPTIYDCIKLPLPSGKGLKPKIEVQAKIRDRENDKTVPALSVFTESQINLLGMAAFLTKCNIEQQAIYVMDDPLQSMDEVHLEAFAEAFVKSILDSNKQLILSTHSQAVSDKIKLKYQFDSNLTEYECYCSRPNGTSYAISDNYIVNVLQKIETLISGGSQGQLKSACSKMRGEVLEPFYKHICYKYLGKSERVLKKATIESMMNEQDGLSGYFAANFPQQLEVLRNLQDFLNSSCDAHDSTDRTQEHVQRKFNDLKDTISVIKAGLTV